MFIGHFAVGFAAKRLAPRTSLAPLMLAPLLADVIWPVLVLAGIERARVVEGETPFLHFDLDWYPWSHSLLMMAVWAALFAWVYFRRTGDRPAAAVLAAGVLSHWLLDWITHQPDMALWPDGPELGLGLWYSVPGTIAVEGAMFVAAVAVYARTTRARDRAGTIGFWSFVLLLAASYAASSVSGPPPGVTTVVTTAIVMSALSIVWAWWFDGHREPRAARAREPRA